MLGSSAGKRIEAGTDVFAFWLRTCTTRIRDPRPIDGKRAGRDCDQRANKRNLLCGWPSHRVVRRTRLLPVPGP
jgi:hypothetical protein